MKNIVSLGMGILIFLGGFFPAHAQAPLSGDDIHHFINAMKPLQELGSQYDFYNIGNKPVEELNATNFFPMSHSLERVKNHQAYGEFQAIIHDAGFSSPEKWASIGDRIMRAYMFGRLVEELAPEEIQNMRDKMAGIEENDYLSLEIRKKILDNLKQILAMADEMPQAIKADQDSLKPFSAQLKRLFEEQQ